VPGGGYSQNDYFGTFPEKLQRRKSAESGTERHVQDVAPLTDLFIMQPVNCLVFPDSAHRRQRCFINGIGFDIDGEKCKTITPVHPDLNRASLALDSADNRMTRTVTAL